MPGVDPADAGTVLKGLLDTWDAAAERMITAVARRLARGVDSDGWAEIKARQTLQVRDELLAIVSRLGTSTPEMARRALDEARQLGARTVSTTAPIAIGSRPEVVQSLAERLAGQLQGTHLPVIRAHTDLYQRVTTDTETLMATGTMTRRDAIARTVDRLLAAGEDRFVDAGGRRWHLDTYARMAGRSIAGQTAVQGQLDQMLATGRDLVIVSDSPRECSICRPWEGRILTLGGTPVGTVLEDGGAVSGTVAEARAAGLHHPNCTHRLDPYTVGLTRVGDPHPNAEGYEQQQQLRALERRARELRRRQAAAEQLGDTPSARDIRRRIRANSAAIDEHTQATGQLRRRDRERLVVGDGSPSPRPAKLPPPGPRGAPYGGQRADPVRAPEAGQRARQHAEREYKQMLRTASDRDLTEYLSRTEDDDTLDRVLAELDRRERVEAKAATKAADEERRWSEFERLIEGGQSEEEAVAEVFGTPVERQRRDRAIATLRAHGYRGRGFDDLARRAFRDHVYDRYIQAEDATRGHMVNPAGRRAGVDPASLFTGPESRARKYASDELLDWWDSHGRVTLEQYKADLLGDIRGATDAQFRTGGEDFLR